MNREYMPNVKPPKARDWQLENAARNIEYVTCERCEGSRTVFALHGDVDVAVACGRCWGRGKHLEVADRTNGESHDRKDKEGRVSP